ncbi:MAG: type III secretion system export apparatus subunit SctR [Desulfobacterales bacterium]|nr:type III secretion system export apparatus subunit SctR [Desulfobacterales bacterium]
MPNPVSIAIILVFLSLAPFIAIMITSFVKIVVVLSLIRNALGVQQIPPNMVLNGIAIILTIYIMAPVYQDSFDILHKENISVKDLESKEIFNKLQKSVGPIKNFLNKHSHKMEKMFFVNSAKSIWSKEKAEKLKEDDLIILIPAFVVSELTIAFKIGFMLYLPFIAIDLIVSNILLAMGMMMVSPMTISTPFKLLLFVMLDGWARLVHGIVLTY